MRDPSPAQVSAVVITLNAASQLEACLTSLKFCAEIVVVDSGSQDETREIAQRCGARVIEQAWLGFGPQKRFGVAQARHDWILALDADERLTPELQAQIETALLAPEHGAYRLPRRNRFLGRWLRHGEGYPDFVLRLFDRRRANFSEDLVHEKVLAQCSTGTLRGDLLHESAETLLSYLEKQNRYTTLQAEGLRRAGRRSTPVMVVMSPLVRFCKFYFLKLGFLDGVPGFVHVAIGAFSSMMKYAKLAELTLRSEA